jgi:hypothetical protein
MPVVSGVWCLLLLEALLSWSPLRGAFEGSLCAWLQPLYNVGWSFSKLQWLGIESLLVFKCLSLCCGHECIANMERSCLQLAHSVALVRERTILTERLQLVGEVSANFMRLEGCRLVSSADPLRPYSWFSGPVQQVAPQLYSRSWVDPVPDPLLLRKSGSAGNRNRTSGSVGRNPDH